VGGQAPASDERPWMPVALTAGVVAVLLMGAVGFLMRRGS
jgi:hypothetical protein